MEKYGQQYWDEMYFGEGKWEEDIRFPAKVLIDFQPESILELGCGGGEKLYIWKQLNPHLILKGIDCSFSAINYAKLDIKKHIVENDITVTDNYGEHDIICAFEVLEHLTQPEVQTVLDGTAKNCNVFLATIPTVEDVWKEKFFSDTTHKLYLSRQQWKKIFEHYWRNVQLVSDLKEDGYVWVCKGSKCQSPLS